MTGIPLVIAEFTGRYRRDLRRFTFSDRTMVPCIVPTNVHDAMVTIGVVDEAEAAKAHGDNWPHDDERWPRICKACGYEFTESDEWQRNDNQIYRRPDGIEFSHWGSETADIPPGTMWRLPWYDEYSSHPQNAESWLVILPDHGQWITTQAASGGGYWTINGTAPRIDVSPSIWHNSPNGWHGFIRNGELVQA